jgi:hypothetical protein
VTQVTVLVTVTTTGTGVLLVELRMVVESMTTGEGALLEGGVLLRNNAVLEEAIPVLACMLLAEEMLLPPMQGVLLSCGVLLVLSFEGVDNPFLEHEEGIISGHVCSGVE